MSINELAYFTECVNNLIDGELIMVDKNIASVLKCVVNCPVLCQCLSSSIKNTSYVTEFSRAKVTWTRSDGVVINQLKLPQDTTRLFTFVVCLLGLVKDDRRAGSQTEDTRRDLGVELLERQLKLLGDLLGLGQLGVVVNSFGTAVHAVTAEFAASQRGVVDLRSFDPLR